MPSAISTSHIAPNDLAAFSSHLKASKRILALLGAGLSASSGLPTFRGAGGYWRQHEAMDLATPTAFKSNPALVWQFYSYRRHMALKAQPNSAHFALAKLAEKKSEFLTISQNVDGLSQRAKHPRNSLELLHGNLFDLKCTNFDCDYVELDNFTDPLVAALDIPKTSEGKDADISDAHIPLNDVQPDELPRCPKCKNWLLRPGVVWFGETLPVETLRRVDGWISEPEPIDLMLVVGTSAVVHPAAGYIEIARAKGAKVAVINTEPPNQAASKLNTGDWFFQGDAGLIVPQILESIIGPVDA
ncbi:MAG: hypothetical protein M1828_000646 [Chrysothrix sp. TS-e1954]|nr:MAG: hypothetical protein M1828_000646 [Chrysothrix sp. TS-e1954]